MAAARANEVSESRDPAGAKEFNSARMAFTVAPRAHPRGVAGDTALMKDKKSACERRRTSWNKIFWAIQDHSLDTRAADVRVGLSVRADSRMSCTTSRGM